MDLLLRYLDPVIFDAAYSSMRQVTELNLCSAQWHKNIIGENDTWGLELRLCPIATYSSIWERHGIIRQSISIFFLTWSLSTSFYLLFGTFCYHLNFDKSMKAHVKFHKNQIHNEIADSLLALFWLNFLTVPIFVAQIHGLAKIYRVGSAGSFYEIFQYLLFILFSDTCVYWLHRLFHRPYLFRLMHKKHHSYIIPTPFSAYAFHPLEAWIMSLPIYAYSFIWPMSDFAQLAVFFFYIVFTFLIHDNREQFHTVHHKNINFNFGHCSILWDVMCGTYQEPVAFLSKYTKPSVEIDVTELTLG